MKQNYIVYSLHKLNKISYYGNKIQLASNNTNDADKYKSAKTI